MDKKVEIFKKIYKREPDGVSYAPYRVCPLGAHSDHQFGKVTGFALNKGIYLAYSIKHNGVIELTSLQFEKRAQWHVLSTPEVKQNDWADYLRGVTISLNNRYPLKFGLCGVINGELPIGGLSSSAAICLCFLKTLASINNINLTNDELINISLEAENKYVGVSCGTLDQSCEVLSKKNHLLYLDTLDGSYQLIKQNVNMSPYKIAIFFSGLERSLVSSKFNMRTDECKATAYALKSYAGIEYGKFNDNHLREVDKDIYIKYKERLPISWARRAEHFYSEFERVEKGVKVWANGDIVGFGKLITESGLSSINNYEVGSPELTKLYEIITSTNGVYGGRFSGAGFKGCCLALIDPDFEKDIIKTVTKLYLESFPNLKQKFKIFICETADGIGNK